MSLSAGRHQSNYLQVYVYNKSQKTVKKAAISVKLSVFDVVKNEIRIILLRKNAKFKQESEISRKKRKLSQIVAIFFLIAY